MSVNLDPRPGDPFPLTTHLLQKITELERENAALREVLEDVQLWLRNDRRNALARANHMEHLHVQTIDARLRDVNAAIDAARKEQG